MSSDRPDERLVRRLADLYANDQQFADARPNEEITAAINQPGLRMPELVRTVMEGYADRPALGQRAVHFVIDRETGRTSAQLLPRFDTITYREVWARIGRIAGALASDSAHPIRPGDRVAVLGFASVDYTTIDLALIRLQAVSVPLQTSAPLTQLRPIVAETEPTALAVDIDHLADAVELVLTEHSPRRLIVFDYRPQVDDQREAFDAAKARLAAACGKAIVETLADLARPRPRAAHACPRFRLPGPPDVADLHVRQHRCAQRRHVPGAFGGPILAPSFQVRGGPG